MRTHVSRIFAISIMFLLAAESVSARPMWAGGKANQVLYCEWAAAQDTPIVTRRTERCE